MTSDIYYPIRYAVVFDNVSINIVRIIEEVSKEFLTVEHFQFESFFNKILTQEPLIVLEDFELPVINVKKQDISRKVLIDLFERYLISKNANYIIVECPRLPRTYSNKYKEQNIPINFHKPLWLCCYNQHKPFPIFETINNE